MIYKMTTRTHGSTKRSYRMDFERYRDDQMNTGVIAALVGGFSLTNSWEMSLGGSPIETWTYVLAIVAVHACTCSALTSAFLYRSLTRSDPEEAVHWMETHYIMASMPFQKFVVGVLAYIASVILVAFKELAEVYRAQLFTLVAGILTCCASMGTLGYLCYDSPAHSNPKTVIPDKNNDGEDEKGTTTNATFGDYS